MFRLEVERREPLDAITDPRLRRLLTYWSDKCDGREMPARQNIDVLDLAEHLGRLNLLDVLGKNLFRFRIHGSAIANPDRRDLTGMTNNDYSDPTFRDLVTRHYQECVDERAPVYHYVLGSLNGDPFEYRRLTLPLSSDGETFDMLIASPVRLRVPAGLPQIGPLQQG